MELSQICSENLGYKTQFIATVRELVAAANNFHEARTSQSLAFARLERAHNAWRGSWKVWSLHQESCPLCRESIV